MKKLEIEKSDVYLAAENKIVYLKVLREYYATDANFDKLELGSVKLRELFRFMSDHGYPKKGFVSEDDRKSYITKIEVEISSISNELKKARLSEIQEKELNSIIIIPSWSKVIGYQTKGFFLNKPVLKVKRDTIVMLSHDIIEVTDKLGNNFALLTGPGIFYTEFSLDQGSYVTNHREINMILLPMDMLNTLLNAPPIFQSDIDATMNELLSIIPFSLIEEAHTIQALLRGVISRNVFLPNKAALDIFVDELENPYTFHPNEGFKILSAHKEFFNRLLLSKPPPQAKGDASFNITSAGIASIRVDKSLIQEFFPDEKQQSQLLLLYRDLKNEFNQTGKSLIEDFMP